MSLANLIAALKLNGARYAIGLRPAATDPAADDFVPATSGSTGGLLVEILDGSFEIATAAAQAVANALLASIAPGNTTAAVDVSSVPFDPGEPFTLIVGTAGVVVVKDVDGNQVTITTTVDGFVWPGLLTRVYVHASNTASNMFAVY